MVAVPTAAGFAAVVPTSAVDVSDAKEPERSTVSLPLTGCESQLTVDDVRAERITSESMVGVGKGWVQGSTQETSANSNP